MEEPGHPSGGSSLFPTVEIDVPMSDPPELAEPQAANESDEDSGQIRLDWSGVDEAPINASNMFFLQPDGDRLLLTFGYAASPWHNFVEPEYRPDHGKELSDTGIPVRQLIRVSVPWPVMEALVDTVKGILTSEETE